MEFIDEVRKNILSASWWTAMLGHIQDPQKFPKKPELLWDPDADREHPLAMARKMLAMFDQDGSFRRAHNIKLH